jgi:hypothetical protein
MHFGIHPWDVGRLSEPELFRYVAVLHELVERAD